MASNHISFKLGSDNLRSCPSPVVDFSLNITLLQTLPYLIFPHFLSQFLTEREFHYTNGHNFLHIKTIIPAKLKVINNK